jgi:hypothetical protein
VEAFLSALCQAKAEAKEEIVHNRVQSCIIVHNRAISWVKPSWRPDSASSPRFLPSPVIQSGGWPRRSPPRHPHELALKCASLCQNQIDKVASGCDHQLYQPHQPGVLRKGGVSMVDQARLTTWQRKRGSQ